MSRHIGIGEESTFNTAVAPTIFFNVRSDDLTKDYAFETPTEISNVSPSGVYELTSEIIGGAELTLNYQSISYLLYMILGDVDTTGAGPYTHTIPGSTGVADRQSYTIEVRRDDDTLTHRYRGCVMTGLTMTWSLAGTATVSFTVEGTDDATGTAATESLPAFDIALPSHVTTVTLNANSASAQEATISLSYPVDKPFVLGSTTKGQIPQSSGPLEVTYEIQALADDLTFYNLMDGSTDVDLAYVSTDGTHSLTVNMNNTRVTAVPININGKDRLTQTISGTSFFDTTATENIQAVVVNDETTVP